MIWEALFCSVDTDKANTSANTRLELSRLDLLSSHYFLSHLFFMKQKAYPQKDLVTSNFPAKKRWTHFLYKDRHLPQTAVENSNKLKLAKIRNEG